MHPSGQLQFLFLHYGIAMDTAVTPHRNTYRNCPVEHCPVQSTMETRLQLRSTVRHYYARERRRVARVPASGVASHVFGIEVPHRTLLRICGQQAVARCCGYFRRLR